MAMTTPVVYRDIFRENDSQIAQILLALESGKIEMLQIKVTSS
jgi:hypothetical protein